MGAAASRSLSRTYQPAAYWYTVREFDSPGEGGFRYS